MSNWKSDCCVQFLGFFLFSLFLLAFTVFRIHIQLEKMVKQAVTHDVKWPESHSFPKLNTNPWTSSSVPLSPCSFCSLCPLCFLDIWWKEKNNEYINVRALNNKECVREHIKCSCVDLRLLPLQRQSSRSLRVTGGRLCSFGFSAVMKSVFCWANKVGCLPATRMARDCVIVHSRVPQEVG